MRTGDNLTTDSEPLNRRKPRHDANETHIISPMWSDMVEKGEAAEPIKASDYIPYVMEGHSFIDYVFFVPRAVFHSLANMAKLFGWTYLLSIFIVYGFQQGIGNAWFFQVPSHDNYCYYSCLLNIYFKGPRLLF